MRTLVLLDFAQIVTVAKPQRPGDFEVVAVVTVTLVAELLVVAAAAARFEVVEEKCLGLT